MITTIIYYIHWCQAIPFILRRRFFVSRRKKIKLHKKNKNVKCSNHSTSKSSNFMNAKINFTYLQFIFHDASFSRRLLVAELFLHLSLLGSMIKNWLNQQAYTYLRYHFMISYNAGDRFKGRDDGGDVS
jgi:hypothetical protein